MSSTVTSGSLAIQFEPENVQKPPTLQSQVQQIIAQRGAFRNLTEKSLEAEIKHPKAVINHDAMRDEFDEEVEDEDSLQARQKHLWKSRDEMLQKLAYAQNEILSALDFVSLTLSNHSKAAQGSMSPALKEVVQPGTLDSRVVEPREISTKTKTRLTKVSEGWKSESFKLAATKLDQASSRLMKEADKQSKYWEQIAVLKSHGWAISRLPNDSRSIGVHFGFQESAPQFRSRGFALLEQDESGDLDLDTSQLKRTEPVKFAVVRNGTVTASYTIPYSKTPVNSDIHTRLQRARDALFEEELFYEISREARLIANQDVRTRTGMIEAVVGDNYSIKITQTETGSSFDNHTSESDAQLARLMAFGARLLLMAEHTKTHQQRSQAAVLMSTVPPPTSEFAILRPILTQLRHQEIMTRLLDICQKMSSPLKVAGLDFVIKHNSLSPESTASDPLPPAALLRKRTQSSMQIELLRNRIFSMSVETYLGSPEYGTIFKNDQITYPFAELKSSTMHNLAEVIAFTTHVLSLELVSQMKAIADADNSSNLRWTPVRPHSGEFLVHKGKSSVAKVSVSIESGTMRLGVLRAKTEAGTAQKLAFAWSSTGYQALPSDETQTEIRKSLKEVICELNKSF